MKTEIMKELRYVLRSGRILILFASFMFFALLTPVMLKIVLPMVLSGQFSGDVPQAIGGLDRYDTAIVFATIWKMCCKSEP